MVHAKHTKPSVSMLPQENVDCPRMMQLIKSGFEHTRQIAIDIAS